MASLRSTWDVTEGEIRDGWMSKVMTEEEVLVKFGKDALGAVTPLRARVIHRYGIVQGKKLKKQQDGTIKEVDKVRCIDDCRRSGHNACQLTHETIATCHYDFLSHVADEIYHQCTMRGQKPPSTLVWGTDDMRSSYRQIPSRSPEHAIVAFWCFDKDNYGPRFSIVWGLNFGHKSVVINYNRSPELICFAARVLFGTCTEHYFDDYISPDLKPKRKSSRRTPPRDCGAQNTLNSLHRMVGLILDDDKHMASDYSNVFLGVSADTSFAFSEQQYVEYSPKPERIKEIRYILDNCEISGEMKPHVARTLLGKLNFTIQSGLFGGCGRAASQPFYTRSGIGTEIIHGNLEKPPGGWDFTQSMCESVKFYRTLFDHIPANRYTIGAPRRGKVVVYTDAQSDSRRSGLGIIIHDSDNSHNPTFISGCRVPHALLTWFMVRKQQINSLEILAVLGAILTYPHIFRNRDVIFFVDNMTTLKICVNGYDRHPDIAHLSNAIHLALAGLSSRVYFEWVPGKANPADFPSRADFIVNPVTGLFVLDTSDFSDKDRADMQ
jgi:hypothetical protein